MELGIFEMMLRFRSLVLDSRILAPHWPKIPPYPNFHIPLAPLQALIKVILIIVAFVDLNLESLAHFGDFYEHMNIDEYVCFLVP